MKMSLNIDNMNLFANQIVDHFHPTCQNRILIAISGGTGVGKTFTSDILAFNLNKILGEKKSQVVREDSFYYSESERQALGISDKYSPAAFNVIQMNQAISKFKQNKSSSDQSDIIIFEGAHIYAACNLEYKSFVKLFDLKIFLSADIRLNRKWRAERDIKKGLTMEEANLIWEGKSKVKDYSSRAFVLAVQKHKKNADIILFKGQNHIIRKVFYIKKKPVILIMGRPASGKSTIGLELGKKLNMTHISAGELLRSIGDDTWDKVRHDHSLFYIKLKEEITNQAIKIFASEGIVIDINPKFGDAVQYIQRLIRELGLYLQAVVHVVVSEQTSRSRLEKRARKVDLEPLRLEDIDINNEIKTRIDKRMMQYENIAVPIIEIYKRETTFIEISGDNSTDCLKSDIELKVNQIITKLSCGM
jgi:uridine kinase